MNYAVKVKRSLFDIIDKMAVDPSLYVNNPGKDFIRHRTLSFSTTLKCVISMGSASIKQELFDFFDFSFQTPSSSALIQQRKKIRPDAFSHILSEFNHRFPAKRSFQGFTLLACDGSVLTLPTNISNESKEKYCYKVKRAGQKDYYQMHLNTLFDVLNKRFIDVQVNPRKGNLERDALMELIEKNQFDKKTIFIADRGYEGYNLMGNMHCRGLKYVIRVKDGSVGGIVKGFHLPKHGEYDEEFTRLFTHRDNAMVRDNPDKYHRIHNSRHGSFITKENPYVEMTVRIIRIEVAPGIYECIATNLRHEEFSTEQIKDIYRLRWGIETSFRELKHTIGLTKLHSKIPELIMQEIWSKMIVYNFCSVIIAKIVLKKKEHKHIYQINYTTAMYLCVRLLRNKQKSPPDIIVLIEGELLPVRPNRKFPRNKAFAYAHSFLYRTI